MQDKLNAALGEALKAAAVVPVLTIEVRTSASKWRVHSSSVVSI